MVTQEPDDTTAAWVASEIERGRRMLAENPRTRATVEEYLAEHPEALDLYLAEAFGLTMRVPEGPPFLKRGVRFHAYPGRRVRYGSGPWIERPVYVVTSVRNHGPSKVIYYRCEASPDKRAEDYATVEYLFGNGLEILPAAPKED